MERKRSWTESATLAHIYINRFPLLQQRYPKPPTNNIL